MTSPTVPQSRAAGLLPAVVAVVLVAATGFATARPVLPDAEAASLASRYGFTVKALNQAPPGARALREVGPDVEHIRSWISAVGAAVAVTDHDGNGRSDDVCLVDPRDDSVRLFPAPGTGARFQPKVLVPDRDYDATMAPMGCVPLDLDVDGDTDYVVHYWGRSPVQFLNTGSGFRVVELVEPRQVWNSTTLNAGDIDGDGNLDLLVANYFPDNAKVLDPKAGPDERMRMQDGMARAFNGGTNRLLLSRPRGADQAPGWTDASAALPPEAAQAWTLAIGLQDLTGDHLPEIYQAEDFGPDHLMVNLSTPGNVRLRTVKGTRDLTSPKSTVLGHDSFKGMGVTFTYPDGAEMPTMVVSNITAEWGLQESNFAFTPTGPGSDLLSGDVPFIDRSEELGLARSGWGWDIKAADFDGDGTDEIMQATGFLKGEKWHWALLQELALGNDQLLQYPAAWPRFGPESNLSGDDRNPFWARTASGRYADMAKHLHLDESGNSRGIAIGDVNADGRPDALVANQWQDSKLLLNTSTSQPRQTVLSLRRPGTGTSATAAIGAQVIAQTDNRPAQRAQLYPANGHTGVSSTELFFATGSNEHAEYTIRWRTPSGPRTERIVLPPGSHSLLLGDDGKITAV
ncbi:ASPIC and UnbV [Lentzea albidocapillata subsp. violacea]|uniref:ASPIC and UnbV n=1 Tax=Lentzea albidocapillata subsp. violacea TaxID=128104 RepID=A0A1G8TZB7_9PSEU|nr:VCBS repeat-containing protein [Lentzea albidocapillata]SDJ46100.1 ASPIC and UnbV [Lentzea albidocapillata subsp. violacea]